MNSSFEPPYPIIRRELQAGKVIPFLGSGASLGKRDPKTTPWTEGQQEYLPTAGELSTHLAKQSKFPKKERGDLTKVAQYYDRIAAGRNPLNNELHTIFDHDFPTTSLHTFLAGLPAPQLIITTNYDDLLERAFGERPYDLVVHTTDQALGDQILWWPHGESTPREVPANKLDIDLEKVTIIYKMHGTVDRKEPERDQYVITEDDYIEFLTRMSRKKAVPAIFAEPFETRPFLFLGYGLNDWNLRVVLNRIEKDLDRPKKIRSWAIQHKPAPLEQRFWLERKVEVYDLTIEEFVEEL